MGPPNFGRVLAILLFSICHQTLAAPYTKYGRSCSDIGCLPSEVCVMTQDSCNFGQRDGKECGRFPTCKKSGGAPPSDNVFDHNPPNTNTYTPTTTKKPSTYFGGGDGSSSGGSVYPSIPSSSGGYTPPAYNPGYTPGGGSSFGGGGGGGSSFGGGGFSGFGGGSSDPYPTTRRTTTRPATRYPSFGGGGGGGGYRPASSSSGSSGFGGFFSGLQNALSGQIGTLIQNALTGKGGSGGFLDTKNLLDNRRIGGLFSENTSSGTRTGQTSNAAATPSRSANYPTQPPVNRGSYSNSYQSFQSARPTTPKYGWNIQ